MHTSLVINLAKLYNRLLCSKLDYERIVCGTLKPRFLSKGPTIMMLSSTVVIKLFLYKCIHNNVCVYYHIISLNSIFLI